MHIKRHPTEHTSTYMRGWTGGKLQHPPPSPPPPHLSPSSPLRTHKMSSFSLLLFLSNFSPSPASSSPLPSSPSSRTLTYPLPPPHLPPPSCHAPPHTCCWKTALHVFCFTTDDIKQKLYWTHIFVLVYCIVNPTWGIWWFYCRSFLCNRRNYILV